MLMEAIASVSLSHDEGCECVVCQAAAGDKDAFLGVWMAACDWI